MTRHSGGRLKHNLSTFVTILKITNPEDKDQQCIYKAYVEVLKENAKSMINRKKKIKKHLLNCEHFLNKYGEEAEEILKDYDSENEQPPNKQMRLNGKY